MAEFLTVHGDLLKSEAEVLVNPVKCAGAMGARLAKQFADAFPEMLAD